MFDYHAKKLQCAEVLDVKKWHNTRCLHACTTLVYMHARTQYIVCVCAHTYIYIYVYIYMYTLHSCAIIFAVESHAHVFCHLFTKAVNMTRISKHLLASASSYSRHETEQDPSQNYELLHLESSKPSGRSLSQLLNTSNWSSCPGRGVVHSICIGRIFLVSKLRWIMVEKSSSYSLSLRFFPLPVSDE